VESWCRGVDANVRTKTAAHTILPQHAWAVFE